jgi:trigger factor
LFGGIVKITKEKIENRQAYLTVELEPEELEEGLNRAYNRLVRKYNVPGFRKGKAPRPILEQFIGKAALVEDAVEHMAPEAYEKAVKEQELVPLTRPEINLDKVEPVTYKMVVPLEPVVKLGDYHQIKLTPESIELKEEEVNDAIEELRHQHAVWEPVERQVNSRDLVNLDIESHVGNQPYINQKNAEYEVVKESEFPLKGFAEQIIGMKRDDTKEFKLSFPEAYDRAELAGKEVDFKVTVKEIKQERLPEVNGDFAKQVNPDFNTIDEMRAKVAENLKLLKEQQAQRDFEQKLINEAVDQSEVEYPPVMIEQEIDGLIRDQMRRWQIDDKGMDEYLKRIQRTTEQLREELRPIAERSVKQTLVLNEVGRKENIEITQDDIKGNIEEMTRDMAPERKDSILEVLNLPQSRLNIASSIAARKVIDKLAEIAQSPVETENKTESAEAQEEEKTEAGAQPAEVKEKEA